MTVTLYSKRASPQWASITPSNADRIGMNICAWKAANSHKNTPAVLMNAFFLCCDDYEWRFLAKASWRGGGGMLNLITQRVRRRTVNYAILTLRLSSACLKMQWCLSVGSMRCSWGVMDFMSSRCKKQLWVRKLSWRSFTADQFLILHYEARSHRPAQVNLLSGPLNRLLQEFIRREGE